MWWFVGFVIVALGFEITAALIHCRRNPNCKRSCCKPSDKRDFAAGDE